MPRQRSDRAYGPYPHGNRWRVVLVGADGTRGHRSFESEAEGQAYVDSFAAISDARTVGQAVTAYCEATHSEKEHSNETKRCRLAAFLRIAERDRLLSSLTEDTANDLYRRRVEETAVATHHGELVYARTFAKWCVEKGWLRFNPFTSVKPIGKKNRGKPKLRINESRKFLNAVLADESAEATAVLMAFMLGMRATEVVIRLVRDLDDDGRLLWITNAKTRAGDREIEIPELLRVRLKSLVAGKSPDDRIFGAMTRQTLYVHTVRLCAVAGVPRVTPHGLRGSAATNAVRMGGSVADVARSIGHADEGATLRRHYLGGGAEESARARQLELLVATGKEEPAVIESDSGLN